MAEIDSKTLQDLANAIKGISNVDMFPRTQDDKNFEVLAKQMEDIEKGNRDQTSRMIKAYDKAMQDKGIKTEIKDLKGVLQAQDTGKAMKSILTTISARDSETGKLTFDTYREAERTLLSLERQAESAGTTLKDMGIKTSRFYNTKFKKWEVRIVDHDKVVEKLTKDSLKFGDALEEAAHSTDKYTERVNFVKGALSKFGNVAKTLGKDFVRLAEQEQRYAQQTATADAGWIDGVTRMQISTLDYMKILKDTRHESLAMSAAGLDFKDSLVAGADSLRGLTADSTEAAMVSKAFHKNMARIGVSQGDLGDAVIQQTKMYDDHYRALGYTADEFANLTAELINDQGMRSTLLALQEKERKQYIMGIQQRQAEYQTMGYTIERAKELQKTFQALNQMNPKDRMKQAAKTRAMMGAMGMGDQGEKLFNLQVRYRTMNADQKKAADIQMTAIQKEAAAKFGEMSGSGTGLGQSMSMQMMAEKTGFLKVAEVFEAESGKGIEVDKEQLVIMKEQNKHTNEISATSKTLLHAQDAWRAAENTALTSIATNLLSGFGNLASINTAGFLATATASAMGGQGIPGGGKSGGWFGKGAGGFGKMAMKGIPLVMAAGVGVEIGNAITSSWSGTESYASFSEGLGKTVDWFASFVSDDAQKRLDDSDAVEAMKLQRAALAEQKETNRIASEQLEETKKATQAQVDGSDKVEGATDNQTTEANKNAAYNKNDGKGRGVN